MINKARTLKKKMSSMQQMSNVRRQTDALRKYKEMLEINYTVTKMSTALDKLISQLDMAQERICDLENLSIETPQTENLKEKKKKTLEDNSQELCNNRKNVTSIMTIPEGEKR